MQKTTKVNGRKRRIPTIIAIPLWILYIVIEWINANKKILKLAMPLGIFLLLVIIIGKFLPFESRIPYEELEEKEILSQDLKVVTTDVGIINATQDSIQTTFAKSNQQPITLTLQAEETVATEVKEVKNEEPQNNVNTILFSQEEEYYLKSVSYAEAGIDGKDAVQAVMHVLYNRIMAEGFGSSISDVVNQPGAFSSVKGGKVYLITSNGNIPVTQDILPEYVEEAYQSFIKDVNGNVDKTRELLKEQATLQEITDSKYWEDGALFFYNANVISQYEKNARANIKVQVPIGRQYFYCYWG